MGRKTTLWTSQTTNKQNLTQENLGMAKKGKTWERTWIFSDNRTKQRHKDQLYQSENRYDATK